MLAIWSAWLSSSSVILLLMVVVVAVALLGFSADRLVSAAVVIARHLAIPPLVIGATIVSLGTTTPEVTVSVVAAVEKAGALALGNGIGSIIVDTGLIMGMVLLFGRPPRDGKSLAFANGWREFSALLITLMLFGAYFVWPKAAVLPRVFGLMLLGGLLFYLLSAVRHAYRSNGTAEDLSKSEEPLLASLLWLAAALALVLVSSRALVDTAVELAQRWRVPQSVVAVSLVAFGTSVPELSTAIASLRKGQVELALGNVFGADVLNVLSVIGLSVTVAPVSFDTSFLYLHLPVMLLVVLPFRLFVIWQRRSRVAWRVQGIYLLAVYLVYMTLLVLRQALPSHSF